MYSLADESVPVNEMREGEEHVCVWMDVGGCGCGCGCE